LTHDTLFILTATDLSDGCQGVDSVRIKVVHHEINENCLVFHNVITPNGDGLNDKWIIDCIENFPENKVTIFNRWGDAVNSFKNYNNVSQVWNGTMTDGKPLPDGTYYYVLTIKNGGNHCGWILLRGI
jgi:gliding motility-associated-like protein